MTGAGAGDFEPHRSDATREQVPLGVTEASEHTSCNGFRISAAIDERLSDAVGVSQSLELSQMGLEHIGNANTCSVKEQRGQTIVHASTLRWLPSSGQSSSLIRRHFCKRGGDHVRPGAIAIFPRILTKRSAP